jgi:hypothetical protein
MQADLAMFNEVDSAITRRFVWSPAKHRGLAKLFVGFAYGPPAKSAFRKVRAVVAENTVPRAQIT